MKYAAGMHAKPDAADLALLHKAMICQRFPAYKLADLRRERADELLMAIEMLDAVQKVQSAG